jgi:2-polyprenyl-3-methyl-5-hydroxy-6-metoxy-1,4-benzoquinol methylase
LDYGCGAGNLSHTLWERGFKPLGSDVSESFISLARETYPEIGFLKATSKDLFKMGLRFDAIVCAYSVIHLSPYMLQYALLDFKKLINRDGYLYLSLQNSLDDQDGYTWEKHSIPYRPEMNLWINTFTAFDIKYLLVHYGFEVIDISFRDPVENEFPFRKMFVIAKNNNTKPSIGSFYF